MVRKAMDTAISQSDTEIGMATFVGRRIGSVAGEILDYDDASLFVGKEFANWVLTIADNPTFKKTIHDILGDKFNEEFFLDGIKEVTTPNDL
jgi:ribose 5-phosphate isomerase RpiB